MSNPQSQQPTDLGKEYAKGATNEQGEQTTEYLNSDEGQQQMDEAKAQDQSVDSGKCNQVDKIRSLESPLSKSASKNRPLGGMSSDVKSSEVAQVTMIQEASSTASLVAKSKPSSIEIISGLAPHVFEEHGMKLRRLRSTPKPPPNPFYSIAARGLGTQASPLRVSDVISWEHEGQNGYMGYFEQPDHHAPIVSDQMFPSSAYFASLNAPEPTAELQPSVGRVENSFLWSFLNKFQAVRGLAVK